MSLKVYYDLLSQPSRAVVLFLKANKIPFEDKRIRLGKGEHLSDEYKKVNPMQKVPAIVDGNFQLSESIAILRYLCRQQKVPEWWYPQDTHKQARVDEYLEWQHLNTRMYCSRYFLAKWLNPLMSGRPAKPERLSVLEGEMASVLDIVEENWLADRLYLAGDQISIADLLGACEMEQPRIAGYDPRVGRPNVTAWLKRVQQELHPYYDEVHAPLNKLCTKYKGEPPASMAKL